MEDKQVTILSIDDEADIRYALKAIFDFEGWDSLLAADVKEGLALLEEGKPDLVLIDYHLPQINGIEGVRMIREIAPIIPILVFTIDENQAVADQFLAAGATDFALKPIKAPDLISRIYLHIKLLKSTAPPERGEQLPKGITTPTLELIYRYFKETGDFADVNQIALGTQLAPQTVNRYIQYLVENGSAEMRPNYGKVGRPRQEYRLKEHRNDH